MQPHATPRFSASRRRVLALVALTAMALSAARASVAETSNPYARAVTALADLLASRFVDPSTGQRYAQALRAGLDAGKYDDIGDAGAVEQVPRQNEQRDRQDRKAVQSGRHPLHDDGERHWLVQHDHADRRQRHRESDRHLDGDQDGEDAEQQDQGHGRAFSRMTFASTNMK